MKTIQTQSIDGYTIITAMHDAAGLIDPEATRKIVDKKITGEAVYKSIDGIKSQMLTLAQQSIQAQRAARSAKTEQEKQTAVTDWKNRQAQIGELQAQLAPLAIELKNKYAELMHTHAVYFSLQPGNELVGDDDAEGYEAMMIEATSEGAVVSVDKKKIPDNRGRVYWKKSGGTWAKTEIMKLGDVAPGGAILQTELTDVQAAEVAAQIEIDRIAALTKAQKAAEKSAAIAALTSQAAQKKTELEIGGTTAAAALTEAKAWLTAETAKIDLKYA